uniref:IS110 family transposase n=1 Tax=Methylobacterium litchii TaxID=3138810 RepID=UPI00313E40D9
MEITTVGIDLAKSIFQVHAVDAAGHVVVRKALRRAQVVPFFAKLPRCLVGMEACGTAHHWAREFMKLGHDVRLMPPAYVKPYVKRGKTDANDAAAICEAVTRPSMRFVPVKATEQQAALALHRTRCQTALNFDPGSASNFDPSDVCASTPPDQTGVAGRGSAAGLIR